MGKFNRDQFGKITIGEMKKFNEDFRKKVLKDQIKLKKETKLDEIEDNYCDNPYCLKPNCKRNH